MTRPSRGAKNASPTCAGRSRRGMKLVTRKSGNKWGSWRAFRMLANKLVATGKGQAKCPAQRAKIMSSTPDEHPPVLGRPGSLLHRGLAALGNDRNLQDRTQSEKIGGIERSCPCTGAEGLLPSTAREWALRSRLIFTFSKNPHIWKRQRLKT